jgi:hypothetical protein
VSGPKFAQPSFFIQNQPSPESKSLRLKFGLAKATIVFRICRLSKTFFDESAIKIGFKAVNFNQGDQMNFLKKIAPNVA